MTALQHNEKLLVLIFGDMQRLLTCHPSRTLADIGSIPVSTIYATTLIPMLYA